MHVDTRIKQPAGRCREGQHKGIDRIDRLLVSSEFEIQTSRIAEFRAAADLANRGSDFTLGRSRGDATGKKVESRARSRDMLSPFASSLAEQFDSPDYCQSEFFICDDRDARAPPRRRYAQAETPASHAIRHEAGRDRRRGIYVCAFSRTAHVSR